MIRAFLLRVLNGVPREEHELSEQWGHQFKSDIDWLLKNCMALNPYLYWTDSMPNNAELFKLNRELVREDWADLLYLDINDIELE